MPNNIKTYDESDDPEDHLKIFQAAAKVERWAMPSWCHMFNSTLTGSARVWFDDLPPESVDSYDDLKKAFRANFLQQNKCIKDLVEIHHIKQKEGESIEDFMQRFKAKSRHVKGAPECMRISGFMHRITNPELIKHLHNKIPKSVDEMMRQKEAGRKQNFERRGDFRNQERSEWRRDKFTLLTKSPKEILALDKGKFKTPPPMTTHIGKRNNNKFSKTRSEKDQPKAEKNGETSRKDKPLAILMVQPWQRVARQSIMQSFFRNPNISFPPLGDEDGTKNPMIIEADIGGHFIHRIYVDGGSALEILYEHCFNRLHPEFKNQMVPAIAPLSGFNGEIIWPIGQMLLLVNWVIGRSGVRKIQAVSSTVHRMLKLPVTGGILTLRSSKITPLECTMVSRPEAQLSSITQAVEERIKVAIHQEYPAQTIAIGSTLIEEGRKALYELLRRNLEIFSWKPEDMTGVPRHLTDIA
ncbi:reverse transcriptase domain-containing protein [Tanacetum coccineum]